MNTGANNTPPLARPPYTMVHNYVIDDMMPKLSPNAWKILTVAIRQTLGWADPDTETGRKECDVISYSQFMEKTGIRGRSTVSRAINQCVEAGYLLRQKVGQDRRSGKPIYAYALNTEYAPNGPEVGPLETSSPETEPLSSPGIGPLSSPETGLTKESKQTHKHDAAAEPTSEQHSSLVLLTALGVEPVTARRLAMECSQADVQGWVEHARRAGNLENRPGLVVARLRDGSPPPAQFVSARPDAPGGVFR